MSDEFFLNDDELFEENSMSDIDKAKLDLLEFVEKKVQEAKDNLTYSETAEFDTNINTISRYITGIMEINMAESDPELSEDDIVQMIKVVEQRTKELSIEDLRKMKKEKEAAPASLGSDTEDFSDDDFQF
jgi:hypothetical protein